MPERSWTICIKGRTGPWSCSSDKPRSNGNNSGGYPSGNNNREVGGKQSSTSNTHEGKEEYEVAADGGGRVAQQHGSRLYPEAALHSMSAISLLKAKFGDSKWAFGGNYSDKRKGRDSDDGLNSAVKFVVLTLEHDGVAKLGALALCDLDANDADISYLASNLSRYEFDLFIFDVCHNQITDAGVRSLMGGFLNAPTHRNTTYINLSKNSITDAGAETLATALTKGELPKLKNVDLCDNPITQAVYNLLAKALYNVNQAISIALVKVENFSKDALKATMKNMLFIASNNGISTKEMLTTDQTIEYCKKGGINVG